MFELNYRVLAQYNKITNDKMNSYIQEISEKQWNTDFNGYFKSIHELCSHIYICDFNWLKRFGELREFNTLSNAFFDKNHSFSETLFQNINDYLIMRSELDDIIVNFISELSTNDLDAVLQFTDSKGIKFARKMEPLILHMFNHETHHRGMISLYLELLGIENEFSSSLYKNDNIAFGANNE